MLHLKPLYMECYTQAGIPFPTNSVASILQLLMGNPEIALKVARYPVVPSHSIQLSNNSYIL